MQHGTSKTVTNLASGAVAAVCATLLTQPTDMLRTHMQLGLGRGRAPLSVVDTWRAVVGGSMGHRALLVGALPRVNTLKFCGVQFLRLEVFLLYVILIGPGWRRAV